MAMRPVVSHDHSPDPGSPRPLGIRAKASLAVIVILGVLSMIIGSIVVSRDIERSAQTTGSSISPKDPGSNMDRTTPTTKGDRAPP